MKMVLDRFEGEYAVCEDMETRGTLTYPIESMPEGVSPGDILWNSGSGFIINRAETEKRRKRIQKLFQDLLK